MLWKSGREEVRVEINEQGAAGELHAQTASPLVCSVREAGTGLAVRRRRRRRELEREFVKAVLTPICSPLCSLGNRAATAASSSSSLQKRPEFAAVAGSLHGNCACIIKGFY